MWKLHQRMGECDGEIVKVIKEIPCQSEKSGLPVVAMKYKYKVQYQVDGSTYYGAYYSAGTKRQSGIPSIYGMLWNIILRICCGNKESVKALFLCTKNGKSSIFATMKEMRKEQRSTTR